MYLFVAQSRHAYLSDDLHAAHFARASSSNPSHVDVGNAVDSGQADHVAARAQAHRTA